MAEIAISIVAEIAISIVAKIAEYLVAPVGRQFAYLFCYNRNIENMRSQTEKLKDKLQELDREVEVACRNAETIRADVDAWRTSVCKNETDVNTILEDKEKVGKGCLNGWCPNIRSRYLLSRKASKKTQNLVELLAQGKFERVADPQTPIGIVHPPRKVVETPVEVKVQGDRRHEVSEATPTIDTGMPSTSKDDFGGFESRSLITRDVMKAIKDDKVRIIGIWGMGGVGKTTMAKEVIKRVRTEGIVDEVAMVVVSQKPDLRKVQDDIAEWLGLSLEGQNLYARAGRLHERLTQKGPNNAPKKILIILDDVWTRLDLEVVGIQSADDHNSCKILLTTREKDVCDQMRTDKTYRIEVLAKEEAINLFQKTARLPSDAIDLFPIAKAIVNECGGLPIAITTIARVLENKSKLAWKNVLTQLKGSALQGEYAAVYATLQVSYDFLRIEEIQHCFRLCCLFPEDFDIPIEDLVRCGVGLKMFKNIKLHEARENAHLHVEMLSNSNLLLGGAVVDCVKMHDLVRDFALSISEGQFLVRFGNGIKEWPIEDKFEQLTSISLQCDEIDELPDGLKFPNLTLLQQVGLHYGSLKLPERFFEGMKKLQVLVWRHVSLASFPGSLQLLTNLRTLSLSHCRLEGDVSIIGKLKALEILSFAHSEIQELPIEIRKISRLRLLDLTGSRKLHRIAHGLLSSLTHLEELYLRGTFIHWAEQIRENPGVHGDGGGEKNASFAELNVLSNLLVLEIDIPYEVLPVDSIFLAKLEKFYVCVGGIYEKEIKNVFQNTLCCMVDTSVIVEGVFNVLCRKTEVMYLKVTDLKNLQKEFERGELLNLRDLDLKSCDEMVSLVNMVGRLTTNVFWNLESLFLDDMSKLKSIFPLSITSGLIKLRSLKVVNCPTMEELFTKEGGGDEEAARIFPRLESLYLENLPSMVGFCKGVDEIELPQLDVLDLRGLPKITSIYSTTENLGAKHQDTSPNHPFFNKKKERGEDEAAARTCVFLRLKSLHLENLSSLVGFCKGVDEIELPQLDVLHLRDLPKITSIYSTIENLGAEHQHTSPNHPFFNEKIKVNNLATLRLEYMESLTEIWPSQFHSTSTEVLPEQIHVRESDPLTIRGIRNLRELSIGNCNRLQNIFSSAIARGLVMLERLIIFYCQMMDAIFWKERDGGVAKIQFPQLKNLRFSDLPNLVHFCKSFEEVELPQLKDVFLVNLPKLDGLVSKGHLFNTKNLRELWVWDCDSVEVAFDLERSNANEGHHELATLTQLQRVSLQYLDNLRHVWKKGSQVIQGSFHNLSSLYISDCGSLTHVFTPSMAKVLVGLQKLLLNSCKNLEAIVAEEEEEGGGGGGIILFPQLTTLSLENLPKLLIMTPKPYTFNWSSLKDLSLSDCGKLMETLNDALQVMSDNMETQQVREPHNLTVSFPISVLQLLQNLQQLKISEFSTLEVAFDLHGFNVNTERRLATLTELTDISLSSLPKLKHVWKIDPHVIHLAVTFQNLSSLCVNGCESLRHVFTTSITKLLSGLQTLKILNCKNLESIVEKEEEKEEYIVEERAGGGVLTLFPQLTSLSLDNLPKLLNITPKGYTFNWPSLKKLTLVAGGKLQETLNGALQVALVNMEVLKVEKLENLAVFFPTTVLPQLQHLQRLDIRNCSSLEVVFDLKGLNVNNEGGPATLIQLTKIYLRGLPKLRHVWKIGAHVIQGSFQNLNSLCINGCDTLKHVFTPSMAKLMLGLKRVEIVECQNLEVIVSDKNEEEEAGRPELGGGGIIIILFPQLTTLRLKKLRNLLTITSKPYTLNLSAFEDFIVTGCDKLPDDIRRYAREQDFREAWW